MKERWGINKDKIVSLEETLISNEDVPYVKPVEKSNACKQLIQCVKLILYLELLMFVGWACYSIWQTYRIESMEVKVTDIREPESHTLLEQHLIYDKNTKAFVQHHKSENVLTQTKNPQSMNSREISDLNKNKLFNEETDIVATTKESNGFRENGEHDSTLSASNDKTSTLENVESKFKVDTSNSAEEQFNKPEEVSEPEEGDLSLSELREDFVRCQSEKSTEMHDSTNEESKQLESNGEDDYENYLLFSLILQSAVKSTPVLEDSTTENNSKLQSFSASNEWFSEDVTDKSREDSISKSLIDTDSTEEKSKDISTSSESPSDYMDAIFSQSIPEGSNEDKIVETLVNFNKCGQKDGIRGDFYVTSSTEGYNKCIPGAIGFDKKFNLILQFPRETDIIPNAPAFSIKHPKRQLHERSDTSATFANKVHEKMYMENEEEKSNDHLALQLLMEKIQNEIVSRFGQKFRRSINNGVSNKGTSLNALTNIKPGSVLHNTNHERENLYSTVSDRDEESMGNDLNKLFRKMEMLATHIDKLQERFLRFNELNDDYVSKEFSSEYFEK